VKQCERPNSRVANGMFKNLPSLGVEHLDYPSDAEHQTLYLVLVVIPGFES
jgi:hypothetical protein